MRTLILILSLMIGSGFTSSVRVKKDLIQFAQMISCLNDRSWTDYNGYGCHCGYGGYGNNALDAIDQCCKDHDDCYDNLVDTNACYWEWQLYVVEYQFSCDGHPGIPWFPKQIQCGWGGSCMRGLCACDKAAVECFRDNEDAFDTGHQNYNKDICT